MESTNPDRRARPGPGDRTPSSRAWGSRLTAAALVIGATGLFIFMLQNQQPVTLTFLGLTGRLPLGVLVLFAALAGALLTGVLYTLRTIHLRITTRRSHPGTPPAPPHG